MATYGAKALTRIAAASQTGFGTAASIGTATGEILFADAVGTIDLGVTVDLGEDTSVGKRTPIQAGRVSITGKNPVITLAESAASLRTLPLFFDAIGATTSGTAVPYSWTWSPNQSDVDTPIFYSMLVTDGVQKYRVTDAIPTEITLSADASGLLQAGATFGATSVATSSLSFPTAIPVQPMLAGRLLKLASDTNFPDKAGSGATDYDHLLSFSLSITTGMAMVNALDATLSAATAAFTQALDATLTITVASNSDAIANGAWGITEQAEQRFLRIYGTTTDNYGVWILGSWVIESVVPLSAEQDGLIVNEVTLRLAYDATSGKSLEVIVDSPLDVAP
jgi:hypothetical protein